MNLIFVSNYYNHHQSALSQVLYNFTHGEYRFIQTVPMEEERKKMGWGECFPDFVIESYKDRKTFQKCKKLVFNADVVIVGGGHEVEKLVHQRIKAKKVTFRYSERIYKNWKNRITIPLRFIKYHCVNSKNTYLLCASAYAARDYAITRNFIGRAYKWGYFPAVKKYENVERLIENKVPASILWVARLIEWKHPDASIQVAKRLKQAGYKFQLSLIGNGELESKIRDLIKTEGVEDCVTMLGAMKPEEVRKHMEQSEIFLFTSDFNEGWGAVLNESMNSGCAVVASHAIGSVPFLIKDGENGLIYKNGDIDDLYNKVKFLLDHSEYREQMSLKAYKTMTEIWNAEVAAERFLKIAEKLLNGESVEGIYSEGPCSKAGKLKNDWKI